MRFRMTSTIYRDYFYNVEQISQNRKDDDLFNAYVHCRYQIQALKIIKNRYDDDVQEMFDLQDKKDEIMDRKKKPLGYLTPDDKAILIQYNGTLEQLRLDHETYIIFARVLMDKIAIMSLMIGNNTPTREIDSFPSQKEYLKKHNNFPVPLNEKYVTFSRPPYSDCCILFRCI